MSEIRLKNNRVPELTPAEVRVRVLFLLVVAVTVVAYATGR